MENYTSMDFETRSDKRTEGKFIFKEYQRASITDFTFRNAHGKITEARNWANLQPTRTSEILSEIFYYACKHGYNIKPQQYVFGQATFLHGDFGRSYEPEALSTIDLLCTCQAIKKVVEGDRPFLQVKYVRFTQRTCWIIYPPSRLESVEPSDQ